jgi:hypothetical protein
MRKTGTFFLILAILMGLISSLSFASETAGPAENESGTTASVTSVANDNHYVLDFSNLELTDKLSKHDDGPDGFEGPDGPGGPRGYHHHGPEDPGEFPNSMLMFATVLALIILLGSNSMHD